MIKMKSAIVGLIGLAVLASFSLVAAARVAMEDMMDDAVDPGDQDKRRPQPLLCPPIIRRWHRVLPSMVRSTVAEGVTIARTADSNGGLLIKGKVIHYGCKNPGSGSVIYLLGDWTQIRYTQEFQGKAACWKIFGATSYPKYSKSFAFGGSSHHTNSVEDFDASQGDGIFNELHMGSNIDNTFMGDVYRCGDEKGNFWNAKYGVGLRRATVMLRRRMDGGHAGISTETSCGQPTYVIKDIWVLM